mgnify:CR=1 FL=1
MQASDKKNIAIVWEGYDAGGVDSYLSYLLDAWPSDDEIYIFYNIENLGVDRLKKIMANKTIKFRQVKTIFKYYDGKSATSLALKYIMHLLAPLLYFRNILEYKKVFQRYDFDILMAQNGGYPGSYGVLSSCAGAAFANIEARCLVIHHAANPPRFGHKFFRLVIEKQLSKTLSSIIAISKVTKQTILDHTGFFNGAEDKISVIENGVPIPKQKKEYIGLGEKKLKIGIIGRLDPHKGHDDFLKALTLLSLDSLKAITVEFIGGYKPADFTRVSGLIISYGLEDIVHVRGYVDSSTTDVILSLDLVAMTTKDFEGFGLTIIEALHAGVPVMATRVGIVPELFADDDFMSFEPGDCSAMASAVNFFLEADDKSSLISEHVIAALNNYDSKYASKRYREHLIRHQIIGDK